MTEPKLSASCPSGTSEELHARARLESDEVVRCEYENLAKQFLRLAEQAKHNASVPPPMKISTNKLCRAPNTKFP